MVFIRRICVTSLRLWGKVAKEHGITFHIERNNHEDNIP